MPRIRCNAVSQASSASLGIPYIHSNKLINPKSMCSCWAVKKCQPGIIRNKILLRLRHFAFPNHFDRFIRLRYALGWAWTHRYRTCSPRTV